MLLEPYMALNYIYLSENGFRETAGDVLSLNVKSRETESLTLDAGLRFSTLYETIFGVVIPQISIVLNHDFKIDDRTVTAGFSGFPDAVFTVDGRDVEKNGIVFGTAVSCLSRNGFGTFLKYREERRPGYRAGEVSGEIRIEF
jgi:outer membrane autotransporter protein